MEAEREQQQQYGIRRRHIAHTIEVSMYSPMCVRLVVDESVVGRIHFIAWIVGGDDILSDKIHIQ